MSAVVLATYTFAGLSLLAALGMLLTRSVLYAAFGLLVCLLALAGLYALAGADFLAVTQIMVYVGGVLVLLLFGIMYTQRSKTGLTDVRPLSRSLGLLVSGMLAVGLLTLIMGQADYLNTLHPATAPEAMPSTVQPLGKLLMTRYLLPFELVAILLLMALIGATYIAAHQDAERRA